VQDSPVPRSLSPSVSINSWNATSTSCYALDPVGRVRKAAVVTNFNKLIASADVSLVQETKCNSAEGDFSKGALNRMAAGCEVFYSNSKKGSAGVATLVRHSFLESNVVTKVKLDPCLKGFVLALLVTPKDAMLKPYTIFNIYLSSHDAASRSKQLKAIMLIPAPEFSFWGGDWNFITDPEDSSNTSFTDQPQNFLDLWSDFSSHFSLKEVHQPLHTYTTSAKKSRSPLRVVSTAFTLPSLRQISRSALLLPPLSSFRTVLSPALTLEAVRIIRSLLSRSLTILRSVFASLCPSRGRKGLLGSRAG
jgi:exonuclease III